MKRKDECFKCSKRKCYLRIYTKDFTFDEIACYEHTRELEKCADSVLNGAIRVHLTGTSKQLRGVR